MEVQVIEKIQGRIDRATGLKINTRLRVAAYARVSTDSEDQLNSFESQVKYYNEKINKNNEWLFVEVYADESISGTQDYKRSNFMRMIQDSLNGKIDLILTKSISRFARNTLDTLKYVRMLKEKNVAILFEEENIKTYHYDKPLNDMLELTPYYGLIINSYGKGEYYNNIEDIYSYYNADNIQPSGEGSYY